MAGFFMQAKTTPPASDALYYLVRQPKIKSDNPPPLLILLHGFGSNESDLFALADHLDERFLIISARAPLPHSENNYKWYNLEFSNGVPKADTAQAEKSRIALLQFIDLLKTKHSFDARQVYLCGFSQGAIMSFSVGLTEPEKVRGIIALSGRVLAEIKPKIADKSRVSGLKTLIIHGKQDQMLPIGNARESRQLMADLGIETEYHELDMGHTVTAETLQLINDWLGK